LIYGSLFSRCMLLAAPRAPSPPLLSAIWLAAFFAAYAWVISSLFLILRFRADTLSFLSAAISLFTPLRSSQPLRRCRLRRLRHATPEAPYYASRAAARLLLRYWIFRIDYATLSACHFHYAISWLSLFRHAFAFDTPLLSH
jgi:hypothetical protein